MKRFISVILLTSILFPRVVLAEDKLPSEPPPPSFVLPIKIGQVVPFDGLLLSEGAAAEIIADKKLFPEKIIVEVSKARDQELAKCNLRISAEKSVCSEQLAIDSAKLKEKDSQIQSLNEKLDKQANTEKKFRELENSTKYYVVGAFAAGIVTTLLTGLAISKISQ